MNKQMYPHTLRQRIYIFGGSVMLMILLVGGLFALAAQNTIRNYQDVMLQMTNLQQTKTSINEVTEVVRGRVVNGEDNLEQCMNAWKELDHHIQTLDTSGNHAMELLTQDLRAYHENTRLVFIRLVNGTNGNTEEVREQYQYFLITQENRQFLCDQLLKQMTGYMADNYTDIVQRSTMSLAAFAAMLLCLLLLTGSFSMVLADNVHQPVSRLTEQAQQLMKGDYGMEDIPVTQQDEIGRLTAAFNTMKNQVRENFRAQEELWRLENMLRDVEFRALQSQVNPHFLFNVLSVATESALMEGADNTVDIIEHISRMLRYSLTSVREESWLTDELKWHSLTSICSVSASAIALTSLTRYRKRFPS